VALPFTLKKSILRQKKKNNYGNSNISPCKNIPNLHQKNPLKRNQNPSRYHNSITNLKSQTQAQNYHLAKILIYKKNRPIIYYLVGAKIP
jgi:hypothetical protein